jgi:heme exporter protein CcmD
MLASLQQFLNMGGYALYVWLAYGSVCLFLFWQWIRAVRRFRIYLRSKNETS